MPLGQTNTPRVEGRGIRSFQLIARLADGVPLAQATEEITAISARLAQEYPETIRIFVPELTTLHRTREWSAGQDNVLVADGRSRVRAAHRVHQRLEPAARQGLAARAGNRAPRGARREQSRIVRQLLVESLLLAALGGVLSYPMSLAGIRFFDVATQNAGRPYYMEYRMDGTVFAVFAGVCLLTGLIFGLAPALHVSKTNLIDVLQAGGRSGAAGVRSRRWTAALASWDNSRRPSHYSPAQDS